MTTVIPPAFAFHFALPVLRHDSLPRAGQRLLDLGSEYSIPWPDASLMGSAQVAGPSTAHVDLRMAWNDRGLGISVTISGRSNEPTANLYEPLASDGLQVWIDTRNTQTIHRASRFCHYFCLIAAGTHETAPKPCVFQLPIARASEDAKQHPPTAFRIERMQHADGYSLEAWLPAATLTGFDVETCSQLGFMCWLVDRELGNVSFTVGAEFPFASDPSLWQTLDLVSDKPSRR